VELKSLLDTTIVFERSIVGFEHLRSFRLERVEADLPYSMLVSEEDEQFGFIVISPFDVYPDYEFSLPAQVKQEMRIEKPEDVLVLSIVTIRQPFSESTINLLAPLVLNVRTGAGRQLILQGTEYQVKASLFPLRDGGEGHAHSEP